MEDARMLIAIPQFLIGQKFQSTIGITLLSYLFFIIYTRSSRRVLLEGIFKFIIESFNFKTGIKLKWNVEDVPDMTGKVVIITGGNTGIGFEIAKVLLKKGAKVYIGARSPAKANAAIKELVVLTGCLEANVQFLHLDLADLPTLQKAFLEFISKETRLDILYNNAGIQSPPIEWLSAQGYDLTFATNVLGPYYFTKLLLPILVGTSTLLANNSSEKPTPTRIIELGSDGHLLNRNTHGNPIDYDTLLPSKKRTATKGIQLYYQSKSANVLLSSARARTLGGGDGSGDVISICAHPGHIRTNITQYLPVPEKPVAIWLGHPPAEGAITPLYAGTAPEAGMLNGKYLITRTREKLPRSDHIGNVEAEDKLVAWLEEQLRMHGLV